MLQPLSSIHLNSNLLQESEPEENGDSETVYFLGLIALLILIIAWVNYINLATAKSLERSKEVGVRKVMGAFKSTIATQFLIESLLINLLALVLSILIVVIILPYFAQFTQSTLSLSQIFRNDIWLLVLGVFFTGSIFSSLYPAIVLSSFQPIYTLKGKIVSASRGLLLRKGLIIFQLFASVFLITSTLIIIKQLQYIKNRDLGFELGNTLAFESPSIITSDSLYQQDYISFKNELLNKANVNYVSNVSHLPGIEIFWTNQVRKPSESITKNRTMNVVEVDADFFPGFDIELIAGRNFNKLLATDSDNIILNLSAIKFLGFENATGALNQKIIVSNQEKTIIGVVNDYNQMSLKQAVAPITFEYKEANRQLIAIKYEGISGQEILPELRATYSKFFPNNPIDYFS